jgi:phosphoglucosamine mutase
LTLRFGTDGVRGVAGNELTPELVLELGRAAARVLAHPGDPAAVPRPAFLIGRDTRLSGPMLQAAFSAGAAAEGVDVVDLGVAPTPAVAAVAASRGLPAAVVSASHNPFEDNGIKLFAPGGRKLSDAEEERIERVLAERTAAAHPTAGAGAGLGRLASDPEAVRWYCRTVVGALEGRSLRGMRVAVDCAHGAATATAVAILEGAGAEIVDVLGASPDGTNINAGCGSTTPEPLASAVVTRGADVGLAFDGDADRVIAVDSDGHVVDGDRLLALFATDMHRRGRLRRGTVVVTVMTNLGFHRAMAEAGIDVYQTPVGDRYVLQALDDNGWSLGGEQSGHIIFRDLAGTGDGVLSGLLLLDLIARSGSPLSALAGKAMVSFPQVLCNVRVGSRATREGLASARDVWAEVRAVEAELGEGGRVLLRPSGTEPLVRVMVEAPTEEQARTAAERLSAVVGTALGSS